MFHTVTGSYEEMGHAHTFYLSFIKVIMLVYLFKFSICLWKESSKHFCERILHIGYINRSKFGYDEFRRVGNSLKFSQLNKLSNSPLTFKQMTPLKHSILDPMGPVFSFDTKL